jgi:SHS2 domain-containing protein
MTKPYLLLDSRSELKIKVFGTSREELFRNALIAMFDSISPRYVESSSTKHSLAITACDQEILLIDFLIEALYWSDAHNEAFYDARIEVLNEHELRAVIFGKKVSGFAIEIKAVTYHDVHIEKNDKLFSTNILFDI